MVTLPITLTMAAAAALINVWLAVRVSQVRMKTKVLLGDAGNERLAARMRAQANFVEYTPFFLILLGLIELARGSLGWLWAVAIVYVVARLAHPFGMDRPAPNLLRMGSVILTWVTLLGLAGYAIALSYSTDRQPPINQQIALWSGPSE